MRRLTALGCDPFWAVCSRELVAVGVLGPWLAYRALRGRVKLPSPGVWAKLLLAGLMLEVVSNTCVQWAFGVVGLAVTIPAFFGVSIAGGAILAWFLLGERPTARSTVGIAMFMAALVLLGMGVGAAGGTASATLPLILGLAAAGLAGAISTGYAVTIRLSTKQPVSLAVVAFLTCLTGVVSLGAISFFRLGAEPLLNVSWEQAIFMASAGALNLIGFLGWLVGLQRTTVVRANMISASQVAMAGAAGIVLFGEVPTVWLLLGIGLTIFGVWWINRPAFGQRRLGAPAMRGAMAPNRPSLPLSAQTAGAKHGLAAATNAPSRRPAAAVKQVA